jgi:two-component system chemotaxis response regulator CheB
MIRRILLAAGVQMESVRYVRTQTNGGPRISPAPAGIRYVVAVGAAEGGYAALLKMIPNIDARVPASILVQLHADSDHVDAFAAYLNECSSVKVKRTVDGDRLQSGTCYVASGTEYVTLQPDGDNLHLVVHPAPFDDRRGSVNMLMLSVADTMREKAVGIVLTGADEDGVEGIGEIIRNRGRTLIQDPATCLHKQTVLGVLAKYAPTGVMPDAHLADTINRMLKS